MSVVVQFTASLNPGSSGKWFTYGYAHNEFVTWSVRPLSPNAIVALEALGVEAAVDQTLTYWLVVVNYGPNPVTFEAVRQITEF